MTYFIEQLLNGLTLGAQYALVAAGVALIFGVVGIINFAHGEFFMLGAYLFFVLYAGDELGPYLLAGLGAILLMTAFGISYDRIVIQRVLDKGWHTQIVATLATSILLINLATYVWGTTPRTTPTELASSVLRVPGFAISYQRLGVFGGTAVTFAALYVFIQRSRTGKAMRAVSQNREACAVHGIDVRRISTVTFALGAGLAALAAVLLAPLGNILPTMGLLVTLKAFAAVIMGGLGRVDGAIYAAFLIGIVEAFAIGYGDYLHVSSAYKDAFAFGMMILILLVRPQGLFGRKVGI